MLKSSGSEKDVGFMAYESSKHFIGRSSFKILKLLHFGGVALKWGGVGGSLGVPSPQNLQILPFSFLNVV